MCSYLTKLEQLPWLLAEMRVDELGGTELVIHCMNSWRKLYLLSCCCMFVKTCYADGKQRPLVSHNWSSKLKSNMPSSMVQAVCRETVELLIEHSRRWFESSPWHYCPSHWHTFSLLVLSVQLMHNGGQSYCTKQLWASILGILVSLSTAITESGAKNLFKSRPV